MSKTRVTGAGLITGDGISGFATRSDLARMRELKRHGLEMVWYDNKNAEQDGLCADCDRQETQKLGNSKRRPLGIGYDAEGKPSRLICTNCASKQRKARAEERNAPKDHSDFQDFWAANKAGLEKENPAELARLQKRHDYVSELYAAVVDYVRGTDRCPEGLHDTLDEVEAELENHGTTDLDQLSAPFYRVEYRHLYDEIQAAAERPDSPKHARNCAVFAKYGYLQGLPVSMGNHVVREFLRSNGRSPYPDWSKPPNPIKTIRCAAYHCPSEFSYNIHERVPGWYFSEPTNAIVAPSQWFCPACQARSAATKKLGVKPRPEDVLYVAGGKMGDLQTKLPDWLTVLP